MISQVTIRMENMSVDGWEPKLVILETGLGKNNLEYFDTLSSLNQDPVNSNDLTSISQSKFYTSLG